MEVTRLEMGRKGYCCGHGGVEKNSRGFELEFGGEMEEEAMAERLLSHWLGAGTGSEEGKKGDGRSLL